VGDKRIFMRELRDQDLLNELTMPIFSFSNFVNLDEAAKSLGWKDRSWKGLSQKLTGGPICNRAKSHPRGTRPSHMAILHERIRVSLLYEFARRNSGFFDQARGWPNGTTQRSKSEEKKEKHRRSK